MYFIKIKFKTIKNFIYLFFQINYIFVCEIKVKKIIFDIEEGKMMSMYLIIIMIIIHLLSWEIDTETQVQIMV